MDVVKRLTEMKRYYDKGVKEFNKKYKCTSLEEGVLGTGTFITCDNIQVFNGKFAIRVTISNTDPKAGMTSVSEYCLLDTLDFKKAKDVAIKTIFGDAPAETVQVENISTGTEKAEDTPIETVQAEDTPTETVQVEDTPTETVQAEDNPAETVQSEDNPAETVQSEDNPAESVQSEDNPTENVEAEDTPIETVQTEDTPAETTQVEDNTTETAQVEDTQAESVQVEDTPAETAQVEDNTAETAQVEDTPAETVQAEDTPAETVQAEDTPAETAQVEDSPTETVQVTAQVEDTSTENVEAEDSPTESANAEDTQSEPSVKNPLNEDFTENHKVDKAYEDNQAKTENLAENKDFEKEDTPKDTKESLKDDVDIPEYVPKTLDKIQEKEIDNLAYYFVQNKEKRNALLHKFFTRLDYNKPLRKEDALEIKELLAKETGRIIARYPEETVHLMFDRTYNILIPAENGVIKENLLLNIKDLKILAAATSLGIVECVLKDMMFDINEN